MSSGVIAFWQSLWVAGENPICHVNVQRDASSLEDADVPQTFEVLRGLPASFTGGDILIRAE